MHQKFKELKKELNLTNAKIADITGLTEGNIKAMTMPSRELSKQFRLSVYVFNKMRVKIRILEAERELLRATED